MDDLLACMERLGHVARTRTLKAGGFSSAAIARALGIGILRRPIRGWVCTASADREQLLAVMGGGRIGCVSALRRWRVWGGPRADASRHVAMLPGGQYRPRPIPDDVRPSAMVVAHPRSISRDILLPPRGDAAVVHWLDTGARIDRELDWIVGPGEALEQAVRCQDEEHALACVESALHERAVSGEEWRVIAERLPSNRRFLVHEADSRAGSGHESIARLRLIRSGHEVSMQVAVPDAGDVDMVVDDLVVFESDGDAYHSTGTQRRNDLRRMAAALGLDLPTLRVAGVDIEDDWPRVAEALERLLRIAREGRSA